MKRHPNPGQAADEVRILRTRAIDLGCSIPTVKQHPNRGQFHSALTSIRSCLVGLGQEIPEFTRNFSRWQIAEAIRALNTAATKQENSDDFSAPPSGYAYLVNATGAYLVNANGAYLLAKV